MINNLITIIDDKGEVVFERNFANNLRHLESIKEFALINDLTIDDVTEHKAALSLASDNYISILNLRCGYLFYLPEALSIEQIDYLNTLLPTFQKLEDDGKIIETSIYSSDEVYYKRNKHERNLEIEEKIALLENRKTSISSGFQLLQDEINRQKEKALSKR